MTRLEIALRRMRNERLTGPPFATPEDAVRFLGAVQSQDYGGAKWGVAQRTRRTTDAELDAVFNAGKILRTHVLRPTWHFVVPEDIRWMLALTAPRVKQAMAYYDRQLALDARVYARSAAALTAALRGGRSLTRAEAGKVLARAGIEARGQRLGHLMMGAELDAVVCSGPLRGKQHTYALLEERVPPAKPLSGAQALAELTRRYFVSHGPAQVHDFAWWSGLTVGQARAGLESVPLSRETVEGKTYFFASGGAGRPPPPRTPIAHLLPNYDELFVGFKDASPLFDEGVPRVNLLAHVLAVDGRIVGGWRRTALRKRIALTVTTRLAPPQQAALARAAARYGRFLGLPVEVSAVAAAAGATRA